MSVSLLDVWRAARGRAVPFAGESAGYLVLLACEEQLQSGGCVSLSEVELGLDARVTLRGAAPAGPKQDEQALRGLLAQLLEVASSPGLALPRVAAKPSTGNLRGFAEELEKALIPLNRAAARRALSRLARETQRAESNGHLAPPPTAAAPTTAPPTPLVAPPEGVPADAAVLPRGEPQTRPETVMARRFGVPDATVARGTGPAQAVMSPPDTPPLGSFARANLELSRLGRTDHERPDSTPVVGHSEGEATERAPTVFEASETHAPAEVHSAETPVSAGTPASDCEGSCFESPLGLSSLPLAVRPVPEREVVELQADAGPVQAYPGMPANKSDVRELAKSFQVAEPIAEGELRRELKSLAGVECTPAQKLHVRGRR